MTNVFSRILLILFFLVSSRKVHGEVSSNDSLALSEFKKKLISIGCKFPKVSDLKPRSLNKDEYIIWHSAFKIKSKMSLIAKCQAKDRSFYKTLFEEEMYATEEDSKKRLPRIRELPAKEDSKSDFAVSTLLREGFRVGKRVYTVGTFVYEIELDGSVREWRELLERNSRDH